MAHPMLRLLLPLAVVIAGWGAISALTSHPLTISPAVWPGATAAPAPAPGAGALPTAAPASPTPSGGTVPFLPGALQQLNGSTRDTATGLYGIIQELEGAVGGKLRDLVRSLEGGR